MGIFDIFKKKKKYDFDNLVNDIISSVEWLVPAMNSSGYKLDFTLESMKEIDRFFDEQGGSGGLMERVGRGNIIFAFGSYVGETAKKLVGGKWVTDENDPNAPINAEIHLSDDSIIWPMQKVTKRYMNGSEDSIFAYMYTIVTPADKIKRVNLSDISE